MAENVVEAQPLLFRAMAQLGLNSWASYTQYKTAFFNSVLFTYESPLSSRVDLRWMRGRDELWYFSDKWSCIKKQLYNIIILHFITGKHEIVILKKPFWRSLWHTRILVALLVSNNQRKEKTEKEQNNKQIKNSLTFEKLQRPRSEIHLFYNQTFGRQNKTMYIITRAYYGA